MPTLLPDDELIVLFDGRCNLCSGTVQRLIKVDHNSRLRFASLQSPAGQRLTRSVAVDGSVDSIVVVSQGKALVHSDAIVAIGRTLSRPFRVAATLVGLDLVPSVTAPIGSSPLVAIDGLANLRSAGYLPPS